MSHKIVKDILHPLYVFIGHVICKSILLATKIRDKIDPPRTDSILFVAHPDDDTLFFHSFIKAKKPYVVLLMTGWSIRRLPCFFRVMKHYGVRCRAYDLVSAKSVDNDPQWERRLQKEVQESLGIREFKLIATHNEGGEYGHPSHKAVHSVVRKLANANLLMPVNRDEIEKYPLSPELLEEKILIFKELYYTEAWAIDELPEWMNNEKLTIVLDEKVL